MAMGAPPPPPRLTPEQILQLKVKVQEVTNLRRMKEMQAAAQRAAAAEARLAPREVKERRGPEDEAEHREARVARAAYEGMSVQDRRAIKRRLALALGRLSADFFGGEAVLTPPETDSMQLRFSAIDAEFTPEQKLCLSVDPECTGAPGTRNQSADVMTFMGEPLRGGCGESYAWDAALWARHIAEKNGGWPGDIAGAIQKAQVAGRQRTAEKRNIPEEEARLRYPANYLRNLLRTHGEKDFKGWLYTAEAIRDEVADRHPDGWVQSLREIDKLIAQARRE